MHRSGVRREHGHSRGAIAPAAAADGACDGLVVAQQFVADRRPGAAQHAASRGHRIAAAARRSDGRRPPAARLELVDRQQYSGCIGVTRSRGPPASGAITGRPDAIASWTAWQNVSCSPGCTKTSMLAYAAASSAPYSAPVKTADGKADSSLARSTPSPTITSCRSSRRASAARRSTCFSGASRPDEPDDRLAVRRPPPAQRGSRAPTVRTR